MSILKSIATANNFNLIEAKSLSGGDINEVFYLKCSEGELVVKLNDAAKFPDMFVAEAKGLELLRKSASFRIPEVISTGTAGNTSYLLLEYMPPGKSKENFWIKFAENLALLHHKTSLNFGLDHPNYIGSLPQYNDHCKSASEFFITQRLEPQIRLALKNGFEFQNLDLFYKNISEVIPNEPPSLIHGDLWNGNILISEAGEPILIDPAVAYAPREMDLAMMKLFGGFDNVFDFYNTIFPLKDGWNERIPIFQLYYLLVHLNIFGSGYLSQVKSIISSYS